MAGFEIETIGVVDRITLNIASPQRGHRRTTVIARRVVGGTLEYGPLIVYTAVKSSFTRTCLGTGLTASGTFLCFKEANHCPSLGRGNQPPVIASSEGEPDVVESGRISMDI